jgi:predicted phosphodiesterase
MSAKHNSGAVADDTIIQWAREFFNRHGALPGRCVIEKQFGIKQQESRNLSRTIKESLLVPAGSAMGVSTHPDDDEDRLTGAALWEMQTAISERTIRERKHTTYRHLYFDGEAPIIVCLPSDLHLGAPGTDHARILADQQLIAATPRCYQINGGDVFDNAIKHRGQMLASDSRPTREIMLLEHLLDLAGHTYIGVVSGNHDDWTLELAGVDVLKMLFRNRNIIYAPSRLHLTLHVGDAEYRVMVTHKYRYNSSLNPLHAVQRMLERGQDDFDIGVIGHSHVCATGVFHYKRQRRGAIRPGSYEVASEFLNRHGFDDAVPSCPCAIFTANDGFYLFDDLRQGLKLFNDLT